MDPREIERARRQEAGRWVKDQRIAAGFQYAKGLADLRVCTPADTQRRPPTGAYTANGTANERSVPMADQTHPPHLQVTISDRGFGYLPPIPSEYGGQVQVSESSAADGPHLWLRAATPADLNRADGNWWDASLHLTAENALRLAEQLQYVVHNHYQGGGSDGS